MRSATDLETLSFFPLEKKKPMKAFYINKISLKVFYKNMGY